MFKLLKYEFRKTWYTKAILLVLTLIAQAAFLIGIFFDKDETLGLSVASLVMLATFGIMVIGLVSLIVFHQDLNTKQSYMLFMTPNSSYKILGAKALENGLSVFLSGVFFALLGLADISILVAHEGDLMAVVDMFRSLIEQLQSYLVFRRAFQLADDPLGGFSGHCHRRYVPRRKEIQRRGQLLAFPAPHLGARKGHRFYPRHEHALYGHGSHRHRILCPDGCPVSCDRMDYG